MTQRHTVAVIQARMSSARLPGKVLKPLLGVPLIVFMTQRVQLASRIDRFVVATSTDSSDDPLVNVLANYGIECFRGNLNDVLDRFYQVATAVNATYVIRLTGDCPLVDADLIDKVAHEVQKDSIDYASNIEPPTYPNGLDVEAFTLAALTQAWHEAKLPSEREHVTPFLRKQPNRFRHANVTGMVDLSALRWTVDYLDDLEYVQSLLAAAQVERATGFDRFDLYRAIERNPSLRNQPGHQRNEGYRKSLRSEHPLDTGSNP